MKRKIAIQAIGETPTSVITLMEKIRPKVTYIICSKGQLNHIALGAGYTKVNKALILEVAKKFDTKVVFQACDVFNPGSVARALRRILKRVKRGDEVIINYTSGSSVARVVLGLVGVALSKMKVRLLYALEYRDGFVLVTDHTRALRKILKEYEKFEPKR